MSALAQTGPNGHNSNTHQVPGLSFPPPNALRGRGFQASHSHSATPPKPSTTPQQQQQHQSPYGQSQHYAPQQPPQGTYPPPLFSTTPSPVPGTHNIPNGNNRHAPNQGHAAASRQRAGTQRQMQQSPGPMFMPMSQSMNQQVQQQVPQPVQQVQQVQQVQPLQQTHQISQSVHQVQQQQPPPPQQQQQQQQQQPTTQGQQSQVQQLQHSQQVHQTPEPKLIPQASHAQARHQSHSQPRQVAHQAHQHPPHTQPQAHNQSHQQSHQPALQQAPPPLPTQAHPQHAPLQSQPNQPSPNHNPPPPPQPTTASTEHLNAGDMDLDSQDEADADGHFSPKLLEGTPFVPRNPMGEMMSAPPEGGSYASLDAVHKWVLTYTTSVGYAVVIGRSKKTVPGLKKVLFVCDRAGKPPSRVTPELRKRKTSSRKCNCQFGFFAIEQRTQWTIRYRPDPIHLQHNHGPSESPLLHPAARKLDSKMVASVKQLKEAGIGVSQTLEILQQQNPHVPLLPRDIYNARAAINRNPQKVEAGIADERPAIYSKPAPTAEERIRSDLRRELQVAKNELKKVREDSKKEIEDLKEKLREKDKMIEKFEMFIDICNQRVMVQRQKLSDPSDVNGEAGGSAN